MNTDRGRHWSGESTATTHFLATDDNLHQQMEKFWKLEEWDTLVKEKPEMAVNDKKALSAWEESITQEDDSQYELDIPFKRESPGLPDNRRLAD